MQTQIQTTIFPQSVTGANERINAFDVFLLCVGLYLVFSPVWMPRFSTFIYENARWFELMLLTVAVSLLFVPSFAQAVYARWAALHTNVRVLIVIALGGGALVTTVSPAVHFGAAEVGLMTQLVFFALCIAALVGKLGRSAERTICLAILCGAGLLVLQFWLRRSIYLYEDKWFPWTSPFMEFANARFFGQYQAYTLFILPLCLVMFELRRWQRFLIFFIIANFWALQWMVGTRAVWVGFAVAVAAVLLFARGIRRRWLLQQALFIACGAVIYVGYLAVVPQVTSDAPVDVKNSPVARNNNSVNARIVMARHAVEYIKERPLTGVGPGQFGLTYRETLAAHPHNSVLQLLSEYGLVAGGAAVALAGCLVVLAVRRLKPRNSAASDPVDVAIAAALMMGFGDSLFSGNIIMPHSQILLCVVAGWLLARAMPSGGAPPGKPEQSHASVRMFVVYPVLLAWAVTMILNFEYWDVTHTFPSWLADRPPHFWQYGRYDNW